MFFFVLGYGMNELVGNCGWTGNYCWVGNCGWGVQCSGILDSKINCLILSLQKQFWKGDVFSDLLQPPFRKSALYHEEFFSCLPSSPSLPISSPLLVEVYLHQHHLLASSHAFDS